MISFLLNSELRSVWNNRDEAKLLAAYERVWDRKRILRKLYETWYEMLFEELRPGITLEIGAGTGNFKRWLAARGQRCWTLDILAGKHVDVQADALHLPFRQGKLSNIVMVDTLHHIASPFTFLRNACRLLSQDGRILFVEPFVSVWGRFVYRYFHHERVDFSVEESDLAKRAWNGNAAIPHPVLSGDNRRRLPLTIAKLQYCEFLSYPLSGGFSYRSLLPTPLLIGLHRLERCRLFQNKLLSLRVFAVLEAARELPVQPKPGDAPPRL
jgi:SAM-dependent methyltransferase